MTRGNEKPTRRSIKVRILLAGLFSGLVFASFLVVLEIVLRTTHLFGAKLSWVTNDPVLGWRTNPGRTYWFNQENDHPITGRINRHGWRDDDWPLEKPEGSIRVAVLGDSFVEAYQVESDRTSVELCQALLSSELGLSVEVMNFGRAGFSQTEELIVLEREVLRFEPDLVIVFFLPENDIGDVARETAQDLRRSFFLLSPGGDLTLDDSFSRTREYRIRALLDTVKNNSALISLLGERWNMVQIQRFEAARSLQAREQADPAHALTASASLCTAHPEESYRRNYGLNKVLIRAMSDLCRQQGVRFLLVTLNTRAYDPKVEQELQAVDSTFDPNFFEDDLREFAKTLGIEYLGLQRVFRQHVLDHGVPLLWAHWNYEGNRLVAETLARHLQPVLLELAGRRPRGAHQDRDS